MCALAALTVRKHRLEGKNPIGVADLEWIFACNYEGTEWLRLLLKLCKTIVVYHQFSQKTMHMI